MRNVALIFFVASAIAFGDPNPEIIAQAERNLASPNQLLGLFARTRPRHSDETLIEVLRMVGERANAVYDSPRSNPSHTNYYDFFSRVCSHPLTSRAAKEAAAREFWKLLVAGKGSYHSVDL